MKYSESLKKNSYFQNVYKNGRSYANRNLVMYVLENNSDKNRIGISVSKKVGNSVIRHHITRLIRESYRLSEEEFCCGWDIVVIARIAAKQISYQETQRSLLHLGKLHRILKNGKKQ
ncbi:ribonuclease P protein component [Lachnospiraceae bacterium 29-84]